MFYPQNVIDDVRMGNDIIDVINKYTTLKQRGSNYFGLCPFHKEKSPSFSVSPDKQLYYCFGCGASGNVISFIMQKENYDFVETVKFLAQRINYTLPQEQYSNEAKEKNEIKNQLYEIHKKAARHFYDNLNSKLGETAVKYLDKRNIIINIRRKYGLGYSFFKNDLYKFLKDNGYNDDIILESGLVLRDKNGGFYDRFINRLMFPIIDVQGRIIGFGGRSLDTSESGRKTPKYLNSPDTPIFNKSHNLYSINFARNSKTREFILVEGYMDVISLYQAGFHNAVAALGTAFNENHANALKRYADKVILLFDSDDAGEKAVLRAIPVLVASGIYPKVMQVTNAKDPDEFINKYGAKEFASLLSGSKSYISFQIKAKLKEYDLNDISQRIDFTKQAAKIISTLTSPIEREAFIKETAEITSLSFESINKEIKSIDNAAEINLNSKKYNIKKYKQSSVGVDDARRSIINICASDRLIGKKIMKILKPKELIEDIYVKALEMIFEIYQKEEVVYPAELVSCFQSIEEQRKISDIFMLNYNFENDEAVQNAVNDQLRLIKRTYIDNEILKISQKPDKSDFDASEINRLYNERRNIYSLNIMLS